MIKLKISNVSALPSAVLLTILILDIAKPGYRKFLLIPEFKSQMAKTWDDVRPTVDIYFQSTPRTVKQSRTRKQQSVSPFQKWISPTPAQPPQSK